MLGKGTDAQTIMQNAFVLYLKLEYVQAKAFVQYFIDPPFLDIYANSGTLGICSLCDKAYNPELTVQENPVSAQTDAASLFEHPLMHPQLSIDGVGFVELLQPTFSKFVLSQLLPSVTPWKNVLY